jgi:LytR cell envelope-related transcriptional attenuator
MSDFIADLEAELRAAASRRRPRRAPRVLMLAAAAAACVALAIPAVRLLAGLAPDRSASGPPACAVPAGSPWLDKVPALRVPAGPALPRAARDALPDAYTPIASGARRVASEDGIAFWVVPLTRLAEGERCAAPVMVCVVTVPASRAACDGILAAPVHDRIAVFGTSARRRGTVSVVLQRGSGTLPIREGVVAGLLRRGARMKDGEYGYAERGPFPVVAVLNGTTTAGLATRARDQLKRRGLAGEIRIGNFTDQMVRRSSVAYARGDEAEARTVARVLRIAEVVPLDRDTRELARARVVVVLGRMR